MIGIISASVSPALFTARWRMFTSVLTREILSRGGSELAECVLAIARKLHMTEAQFPVAYVGGAFHAAEMLLSPMRLRIERDAPGATLTPPERTPVEGAAMMAMHAAEAPRAGRA